MIPAASIRLTALPSAMYRPPDASTAVMPKKGVSVAWRALLPSPVEP
jgi:hypothetical protein